MNRSLFVGSYIYVAAVLIATVPCVVTSSENLHYAGTTAFTFNTEQDMIDNALKSIKQSIRNKTGTFNRVDCCYKMIGNIPLSASTKIYYSDYRKKPDYQEQAFNTFINQKPTRIVQVIYKNTEKNQLAIVDKDPIKNRRLGCKYVSLSNSVINL